MEQEQENIFYEQLARTIQTWQWVESELYFIYSTIMKGANSHLISATFHHIQSFVSKLQLVNSCLALMIDDQSEDGRIWKDLFNRSRKLNEKRNKIVHEPVHIGVKDGHRFIEISPSFYNALVITKHKTTHKGPTITSEYKPSNAQVLENHKIDLPELYDMEQSFKNLAKELEAFRTAHIPDTPNT
ncbi:MAG: hypothetical protein PHP93_03510 [Kiritimatiellales bacterium]|nr:hypothetical protein [Kiritimatiellales bacterium]